LQIADWQERFDALVERKTAAARDAAIAPLVTDRDEAGEVPAHIGNAWSRAMFGGLFYVSPAASSDLPATNLVFVQSSDGNTGTDDPSTLGGGAVDTHVIYEGLSRVAADAVLSGSRTIGGSDFVMSVWRPELVALRAAMALPRHPIQIVATQHGVQLDQHVMFNVPELRVILITVARGEDTMRAGLKARPWITPVVMDDPLGLGGAFRELRRLGVEHLSCIGGRTLAGAVLDAGLIQDIYLTTGTKAGGEPNTPFYAKRLNAREIVRKHGTGPDAGVVFQHLTMP
jgi:riboflavin biosynthesis pyrimidine reductase